MLHYSYLQVINGDFPDNQWWKREGILPYIQFLKKYVTNNLLGKGWTKNNLLEKGWTKIQPVVGKYVGKIQPVVSETCGQKSFFYYLTSQSIKYIIYSRHKGHL